MSMKVAVKRIVVGPPGVRPRAIQRGLLKGLGFHVDSAIMSQRLLGLYEAEITRHVRQFASLARSAVDVGANDGWYSLYFTSCPNIARVLAVDAGEQFLEQLRRNFALNPPACSAKLDCRAEFVGDADSESTCTLDSLTADLPRPVLVKIDVDGGELDVLRGGRQLIASGDALLIVETHGKELEVDCLRFLEEHGYGVTIVPNAWYRLFVPERRPIAHNRWFVARRGRAAGSSSADSDDHSHGRCD